jgi:hypothetical protein
VSLLGRILVGNTIDASVSGDGDAKFEEVRVSALSMVLVSEWKMVQGAGCGGRVAWLRCLKTVRRNGCTFLAFGHEVWFI